MVASFKESFYFNVCNMNNTDLVLCLQIVRAGDRVLVHDGHGFMRMIKSNSKPTLAAMDVHREHLPCNFAHQRL